MTGAGCIVLDTSQKLRRGYWNDEVQQIFVGDPGGSWVCAFWHARAFCVGSALWCVRCERGKNLVDPEWGLGYFGRREMTERHPAGYSRDLIEGWLWQGMRSISI